jgi:hypothetical protein
MKNPAFLLAAVACALVVLASSGCVDIYGAKGVFSRTGTEGKTAMKDRTKVQIQHNFETTLTNLVGSTTFMPPAKSFRVKPGAEWLKIWMQLTLIPIPSQLPIPPNLIPQRYLHVKVVMADGTTWLDARYTISTLESVNASGPIDGPWSVSVDAVGVGLPQQAGYQDSLQVLITVREPA